jgi:hypothetical protein
VTPDLVRMGAPAEARTDSIPTSAFSPSDRRGPVGAGHRSRGEPITPLAGARTAKQSPARRSSPMIAIRDVGRPDAPDVAASSCRHRDGRPSGARTAKALVPRPSTASRTHCLFRAKHSPPRPLPHAHRVGFDRWCSALPLIIDPFGRSPGENDGLNWPHCDGVGGERGRRSRVVAAARCGEFSLARWPTTEAARGCRIGLMQRSALLPGLSSPQPLVLGCAVSDRHVPVTVCGTGAVRSRSDGSGPLDATFAAAFWSA